MIFYLLLVPLTLGSVASHQANTTEENLQRNQTLAAFTNTSVKTLSVSSDVSKDDLTTFEDRLQSNQTPPVVTEDDERFQDQELLLDFSAAGCDRTQLAYAVHSICAERFHRDMQAVGADAWCVLEAVIRPYNDVMLCVETVTNLVGCYYPNAEVQDFFLFLHSSYFHSCSQEQPLADAPQSVVLALTAVPVGLIPGLVYLAVRRS